GGLVCGEGSVDVLVGDEALLFCGASDCVVWHCVGMGVRLATPRESRLFFLPGAVRRSMTLRMAGGPPGNPTEMTAFFFCRAPYDVVCHYVCLRMSADCEWYADKSSFLCLYFIPLMWRQVLEMRGL